jgi:hypothetical protein
MPRPLRFSLQGGQVSAKTPVFSGAMLSALNFTKHGHVFIVARAFTVGE